MDLCGSVWSSTFRSRCPVDSIRDAVLTVSPNRQYLGIFTPTTPAAHGPARTSPSNASSRMKLDAERGRGFTWVHADAYPHGNADQMSQLEGPHELQDVQRHAADVHRVHVPVSVGQTGGDHVRVANGLHLQVRNQNCYYFLEYKVQRRTWDWKKHLKRRVESSIIKLRQKMEQKRKTQGGSGSQDFKNPSRTFPGGLDSRRRRWKEGQVSCDSDHSLLCTWDTCSENKVEFYSILSG